MKLLKSIYLVAVGVVAFSATLSAANIDPRFSVAYMDRSIAPQTDFYGFAAGTWTRNNPVPADKSRWSGFEELQERNWQLIQGILTGLESSRGKLAAHEQQVADFYRSAMNTNRLESLQFKPLREDLRRIDSLKSVNDIARLLADFHLRGIGVGFGEYVSADERNSGFYAFYLGQGGLGLPDRDYYLKEDFAKQRGAYRAHVGRMLALLNRQKEPAEKEAALILELETALAKASKTRTELRDSEANYNKFSTEELTSEHPELRTYIDALGAGSAQHIIIGQPQFFEALYAELKDRPVSDWKTYLRWHLLRSTAPYLHSAVEQANFEFYGRELRGQQAQEPRWQRSAKMIDEGIGEALGQIFVAKYFPPAARAKMLVLVDDVKAVFRERLQKLEWMTEPTREKALAKFARFTEKIGHPQVFRDYSSAQIKPDDLLGNVERASLFESRRQLARIGKPVDRSEWFMTPQTVNAYFNPTQNEIVFPAGILQPPFFDMEADDALNYGAIGMVIGHEITHGYDDEGRKYNADGNLQDWWTEADAKAFDSRAEKLVSQYAGYEALPGLFLNGRLTLGENIADLGGVSIGYEALQRALARDPAKRKLIDGFTPEQRFFIAGTQLWRTNIKEEELRRRVTVDPHSPGRFRATGAHVNLAEFFQAFDIKPGDAMWRSPDIRAKIW